MNSLISGFTFALMTNSALIVSWSEIDKYIEEPMEECFQINPSDNELNYRHRKEYEFPYLTYNSFAAQKKLEKNWGWENIPLTKNRFLFTGLCPIFFELCFEKKNYDALLSYGIVSQSTIDKARQVLEKTPPANTDDNLNKLYRVGFEVAHSILNIFWRPSAYLQKEVDYYYEKYFKNNFVIGIQLRLAFLFFAKIFQSFQQVFFIFRYWYAEWADTEVFIKCALDLEKSLNKSVKWFVTSDDAGNLNRISMNYSAKMFTSNGTIAHFVSSTKGYHRTLLDVELLSMCDEIIMTGGSTYGFLSALKSGKYPLFVNGRRRAGKCDRFSFSNPSLTPGPVYAVV
jgi:hypothetical protein